MFFVQLSSKNPTWLIFLARQTKYVSRSCTPSDFQTQKPALEQKTSGLLNEQVLCWNTLQTSEKKKRSSKKFLSPRIGISDRIGYASLKRSQIDKPRRRRPEPIVIKDLRTPGIHLVPAKRRASLPAFPPQRWLEITL